jgi:hypothetical protein
LAVVVEAGTVVTGRVVAGDTVVDGKTVVEVVGCAAVVRGTELTVVA